MSTEVVLLARAPLPDGFPGPATDGNAPFWAAVSLHSLRVDRLLEHWPEGKAVVDAQGGAVAVVHLEGPARAGEFMTEYAEILQLAVGGTIVISGRQAGEPRLETDPEHRSADAIRAGLIGTDLWLMTDKSYQPGVAARAEERGDRYTIIPRAPGVVELPTHPDITMTLVPLDDDWARRNLYALSRFIPGDYGPPTTRAAQYRTAIAEFATHVLEIPSDNSEETLDAVVEVATAIETAMGGRGRAPITVIDESGDLVDL